jgi:hypothetical protein
MAYSIYADLKPSVLGFIPTSLDLYLIGEFFEPEYRKRVRTDASGYEYLFYYLKPKDDSRKLLQLFYELVLLAEKDYLINLSDDTHSPKPRVWQHSNFPKELKPYAVDDLGNPVF